MQDPSHPLAHLLRQLSALGSDIFTQGQREASVHLDPARQNPAAIMLVAMATLTLPASTSALCAANDNQGD